MILRGVKVDADKSSEILCIEATCCVNYEASSEKEGQKRHVTMGERTDISISKWGKRLNWCSISNEEPGMLVEWGSVLKKRGRKGGRFKHTARRKGGNRMKARTETEVSIMSMYPRNPRC